MSANMQEYTFITAEDLFIFLDKQSNLDEKEIEGTKFNINFEATRSLKIYSEILKALSEPNFLKHLPHVASLNLPKLLLEPVSRLSVEEDEKYEALCSEAQMGCIASILTHSLCPENLTLKINFASISPNAIDALFRLMSKEEVPANLTLDLDLVITPLEPNENDENDENLEAGPLTAEEVKTMKAWENRRNQKAVLIFETIRTLSEQEKENFPLGLKIILPFYIHPKIVEGLKYLMEVFEKKERVINSIAVMSALDNLMGKPNPINTTDVLNIVLPMTNHSSHQYTRYRKLREEQIATKKIDIDIDKNFELPGMCTIL